jgi:hypothetical protein
MEVLEVCLRTTYYQVDDKFFQQKDGMAMRSSLSPILSNIYMELLRNWLLTQHSINHHCGSLTLMTDFWPMQLQNFLGHLNRLKPFI